QCRACRSAKSHAATIAKTYGLTAEGYADLLERQGGRCAICFGKPRTKRLAVDHRHDEEGAVRGLLCSKCNNEALGSLHDSAQLAWNAWVYLTTPPATVAGSTWESYLNSHPMPLDLDA